MKKGVLFALFVSIIIQHGFSQIFLGGGFSYQHSSSNVASDIDMLEISSLLGYRFNKADIGMVFLYQSDASSSSSNEARNIGFGAFGSYRFFTVDKFSIFGRMTVQYINSKYSIGNDTGYPYYIPYIIKQNINNIGISITPLFEYKLFEHFSLYTNIGSISFSHSWGGVTGSSSYAGLVIPKENISADSFGISFSTGITLGFHIFF
jgi:hypothetical protein